VPQRVCGLSIFRDRTTPAAHGTAIVRDLPAAAINYDWQLPPSTGIPDVRSPNRRERHSLPEQFLHQRAFQHHAFQVPPQHQLRHLLLRLRELQRQPRHRTVTPTPTATASVTPTATPTTTPSHATQHRRQGLVRHSAQTVSDCLTMSGSRLLHGTIVDENSVV
jgi:hypothetical protein